MTDNSEALLRAARAIDRKLSEDLAVPANALVWSRPGGCSNFALNLAKEIAHITRPSSPAATDGDAVEPKPVAWSYEYRDDYKGVETGWHTRLSLTPVRSCAANAAYVRNVVPLYATPPSPASSTDVAGLREALIAKLKRAKANGDPTKYLAGISVAEAHAIAALLEKGATNADHL